MLLKRIIRNPIKYLRKALTKTKNIIRTRFSTGKDVICLICGWTGRKFYHQKCPKCNTLPRTRLVGYSFKYFKLLFKGNKILHLAPNKPEYDFIRKSIDVSSKYDRLDILPYSHVNLLKDITDSGLASSSYDLIVAWHMFEHIPNDKKAISEVYRILKPSGKALVSVPIYPAGNAITFEDSNIKYEDYEKVHGHFDHCRSCGLDYFERFEDVGFSTQTLNVIELDKQAIKLYGLREDHVVWCFTK